MTPTRLKVGVMGVGHLGAHHARIYSGLPGVELVGVHDRDPRRAQAVAAELGCRAFASPRELGQSVAALSIAVPARAHAEVALPSLERGVAVLIEKPMAASVEAARALQAAAAASGAPLMVGHVERWNGAFRKLRAI
jgi:predicted dehydrogenase